MKIKIILLFVLYGCVNCFLILGEEHRLGMKTGRGSNWRMEEII